MLPRWTLRVRDAGIIRKLAIIHMDSHLSVWATVGIDLEAVRQHLGST
jgi:hypothetical protein